RMALNVPCFDGPSPTEGENSTSPVIRSGVSNFPLHINVPASRPTLPRRNSIGPENVTAFPSPWDHFASEDLAAPQTFACGSVSSNVPFPPVWASKRNECCAPSPNVSSMFQFPVMFGDSASAMTEQKVFTANTRMNAHDAFTSFSNLDSGSRQGLPFGEWRRTDFGVNSPTL